MATLIGSTGYIGKSPKATYSVYLSSSKRLSNSTMQYTFTVYYNMQYAASNMGSGNIVQCRIYVGSGSWSSWATLKSSSSSVSGTSTYGGVSITVTAPSSSSGASLAVYLAVDRDADSFAPSYSYSWSGKVGNVTTAALLYTACSAPTSVSCSTSIGTPGQSITVSWSGAKAGTNNTIQSYTVFYAYGSTPTTSSSYKTVSTKATSGSTTIPISSSRGVVTYVKVRTNGSAGASYYSSLSTVTGTCTTNSLPKASSYTMSGSSTLPSTGGSITYTVTAGSDADSGQTRTLYYSRNNGTTKTKFTNPLTLSFSGDEGEQFPVTFYTYDGLEYSGGNTHYITINTKPTINLNVTNKSRYHYNGTAFTEEYTLNTTTNKSVNYYYYIVVNGTSYLVSSKDTDSLVVRAFQYVQPGDSYYFRVRGNDGVEYSDYATSSTYTAPATYTSITRHYNQLNNSNITYSNGDFYDKIRVYLPTDSYSRLNATTTSATYQIGTGTSSAVSSITYTPSTTDNVGYSSSSYYCDITIPTSLSPGQTYTFTITIKTGSFIRTYTFTKRRTYSFPGGNISGSLNDGTISNPFSNPPTISFNIPAPANFINNSTYDYYNFNLSSASLEGTSDIRLRLTYNNKHQDYFIGGDFLTVVTPTSDDTMIFNLPGSTWTYLLKSSNLKDEIVNALNSITIQASLRITNLFGVVSIYTSNFTFNPKESTTINSLTTKLGTTTLSSSSTSIREGQTFNWTYIIEGYNAQTYTALIQIYRSTNATTPTGGSWINYKSKTFSSSSGDRNGSDLTITTTETDSYTIPQLSESKYIFFRLQLTDSYNQTVTSGAVAAGASNRHIAPSITITGYNYTKGSSDDTGTISITYTINDNGADRISGTSTTNNLMSLTNSVQIIGATTEENNKIISRGGTTLSNTNNSSATTTATVDNFTESNIQVYVRFKTRLSLDSSISTYDKTFDSVILTIYNINPTIAVRKQYLGINSTAFEDDRVIVIAAGEQGVRKKMVIETEQVGKETYIDITTGEMFDFIIDGGSW